MRDIRGKGVTGGRGAAPIWADFMIKATGGEPPRDFTIPSDIRFIEVNPKTGSEAGNWTAHPLQVALRTGQEISDSVEKSTIIEEDLSPEQ
jgi:penicillin-binding protein 1A